MEHYAGIDVSLKESSVCVVDATGKVVREVKVASEPEALVGYFDDLDLPVSRIGLEAGPLSQWLHAALVGAGREVILLETRHVKAALSAMTVKTDRKDARGIAQLLRMGWYRAVHAKAVSSKDTRALLVGRKLLETSKRVRTWLDSYALTAVSVAGVLLRLLIAWPFLSAIVWALALTILFLPLHARMEARLHHPNLAALLSVAVGAIVVVVPAAFVIERLITEAASGAATIQARVASGELQKLLDAYPRIARFGAWIDRQFDLPSMMASLATWLSNIGATFLRGSFLQIAEVFLTFYLLFYFLRDRRAIEATIKGWLPLTSVEAAQLFRRVIDTVHATVYGTLAVAAVQGLLGGLMFWALGLPTPLLWGLVMGLLSIIPVLGAFIVWIPAAILLMLDGSWVRALILSIWGGIVVGGIDNVLRPMFVGTRLRLHTIPAFISMIGGLVLFGAPGFILGPLTITLTMMLVEFWTRRAAEDERQLQAKGDLLIEGEST